MRERDETGGKRRRRPRPANEHFARQFRAALNEKGWTQEEFCLRAGFNRNTVGEWPIANRHPRVRDLPRIAAALDKPVAYFVDAGQQEELKEAALDLVVSFLRRVMAGEGLAAAIGTETGDPALMDDDRHRRFAAVEADLRQHIRRLAPLVWEEMDEGAHEELLRALVRGDPSASGGGS